MIINVQASLNSSTLRIYVGDHVTSTDMLTSSSEILSYDSPKVFHNAQVIHEDRHFGIADTRGEWHGKGGEELATLSQYDSSCKIAYVLYKTMKKVYYYYYTK